MWRAEVANGFGVEQLRWVRAAKPEPGPGEVRVRLTALSLNYRDYLLVTGAYDPRQPMPFVPVSDGVGVVDAVGAGVDEVVLGDRVSPVFCQSWLSGRIPGDHVRSSLGGPIAGTAQQWMVLPAQAVVAVPEHLSDAEAATLPCAAVTAWQALEGVGPGDVVLTQGTGGVSLWALQLAVLRGAKVIITSSSDEKLARAARLGAWRGINYRTEPRWGRAVRALVPDGADRVVELGGAGTINESLRAVRAGGTIALIGVLDGVKADVALTKVLMQGVCVQGIFVGSRAHFQALCAALSAAPDVRPVIDRVLPAAQLAEGLRQLGRGGHFGKLVVSMTELDGLEG